MAATWKSHLEQSKGGREKKNSGQLSQSSGLETGQPAVWSIAVWVVGPRVGRLG